MDSRQPHKSGNVKLEKTLSSLENSIYSYQTRTTETIPFEALAMSIKEKRMTELKYWLLLHNLQLIDKASGLTILHTAICWGDSTILELLLENSQCKKLIDTADQNGLTPLICAVQYNHYDMVYILCNFGASTLNAVHATGQTALHYAIRVPNNEILSCLLKYNSTKKFVNATDAKGDTALIAAARINSPAVGQLLLARADYMKGNTFTRRTILHETVAFSHISLLQEILEKCPSPVFIELSDCRGDTPLMLAVKLNKLNIVQLLIKKQKHTRLVNTKSNESVLHMAVLNDKYQIFQYLLSHIDVELLECPNQSGMTPLLLAEEVYSYNCLKLMISKGYIHTKNTITGEILLHSAVKHNNLLVLSQLASLKSLHWFLKQKNKKGKTPFWSAIEAGNHLGIISFLIAGWTDVNELNEHGDSCLFVSAKYGFVNVLKALLLSDKYYTFCKNFASKMNVKSKSVLQNAEIRGDIYSTDLFILFGKKPKTGSFHWIPNCLLMLNKKGQNIFHACGLGGNLNCLKFMFNYFKTLQLNIKLFDQKSNAGDTPLMSATQSALGDENSFLFFLENGANITSVNNNKMSVLKSIILHSVNPTELLIKVFNSFVKESVSTVTEDEETDCMEVDFSILTPKHCSQITAVKMLGDELTGEAQTRILQHPLIKMFIDLKWTHVEKLFVRKFILTLVNTVLLSIYLTLTIMEYKVVFTHFFTYVRLLLIILNLGEILMTMYNFSLKNILLFLAIFVLVIAPCLSTVIYVLFNDNSQTMNEVASFCVLMSWTRLLTYSIKIFTEMSHQVCMLSSVLYGISKYIPILSLTVLSFSLAFYCIFNDNIDFSEPLLSLMYTFFLMLPGNLEDSLLYFLNKHYFIANGTEVSVKHILLKNIDLLVESSVLLLFVFVCVIGMLNMLVSLAVEDSNTLVSNGDVFQRHLQIQLLNNLEAFFETKLFSVLSKSRLIYLIGAHPGIKEEIKLKLTNNKIIGPKKSIVNSLVSTYLVELKRSYVQRSRTYSDSQSAIFSSRINLSNT